jgi:hypothetical protein
LHPQRISRRLKARRGWSAVIEMTRVVSIVEANVERVI